MSHFIQFDKCQHLGAKLSQGEDLKVIDQESITMSCEVESFSRYNCKTYGKAGEISSEIKYSKYLSLLQMRVIKSIKEQVSTITVYEPNNKAVGMFQKVEKLGNYGVKVCSGQAYSPEEFLKLKQKPAEKESN